MLFFKIVNDFYFLLCVCVYFLNIIQRASITLIIRKKTIKVLVGLQKKKSQYFLWGPPLVFFHENIFSLHGCNKKLLNALLFLFPSSLSLLHDLPLILLPCFYCWNKIVDGGENKDAICQWNSSSNFMALIANLDTTLHLLQLSYFNSKTSGGR